MADLFLFLELVELLKNTERQRWIDHGIIQPESLADHMYRMAIICRAVPGSRCTIAMQTMLIGTSKE
jgi:5'-deoxynucleotidase YfbR-like HD superfamily hydrolase